MSGKFLRVSPDWRSWRLLNFVFQESFDLAGDFDAWDQLQGAFFNRGGALGNDLASYQGYVNLVPVGAGLAALSIIGAAGPQPFGPLRRGPLPVAVGPTVTLTGVLHVNLANGDGVRILGDDRTWVALFPRGVVPNPEPATLWMVGVGVLAVTLQRTRAKR